MDLDRTVGHSTAEMTCVDQEGTELPFAAGDGDTANSTDE